MEAAARNKHSLCFLLSAYFLCLVNTENEKNDNDLARSGVEWGGKQASPENSAALAQPTKSGGMREFSN